MAMRTHYEQVIIAGLDQIQNHIRWETNPYNNFISDKWARGDFAGHLFTEIL